MSGPSFLSVERDFDAEVVCSEFVMIIGFLGFRSLVWVMGKYITVGILMYYMYFYSRDEDINLLGIRYNEEKTTFEQYFSFFRYFPNIPIIISIPPFHKITMLTSNSNSNKSHTTYFSTGYLSVPPRPAYVLRT